MASRGLDRSRMRFGVHLNQEWMARILILALVMGLPLILLSRRWPAPADAVEIHALMPEDGGWLPGTLTARVGEPLHLRLTSDDVIHGFAIGPGTGPHYDVKPGEITEAIVYFDQPGTYTYYCTRWCGPNHWRMRGTIEVLGEPQSQQIGPQMTPLYLRLEIDLDAPHLADFVPSRMPVAERGAAWADALPAAYWQTQLYQQRSPAEVWQQMETVPTLKRLNEDQRWDLVGFVWQSFSSDENLEQGRRLYQEQCAACHGEKGGGDGVMAPISTGHMDNHVAQSTTDFTDPEIMLGANSAILHGKIARGGMGTGMPNWGTIFNDEQIWALVDYLWRFQFP